MNSTNSQEKNDFKEKTINTLLGEIRTKGINDCKPAKELLIKLTGEDTWTTQQCRIFCKSLFCYYLREEEEDLELILAVSGYLNDKFASMDKATERRKKYLDMLQDSEQEHKYKFTTEETLRRSSEEKILKKVAKKIQDDLESGEMLNLIKQWLKNNDPDTSRQADVEAFNDTDNANDPESTCNMNDKSFMYNQTGGIRIEGSKNVNINIGSDISTENGINNRKALIREDKNEESSYPKPKPSLGEGNFPFNKVGFIFFGLPIICLIVIVLYYFIFLHNKAPVEELFVSTDEIILEPGEYYYFGTAVGIIPKEAVNAPLNYVSSDTSVVTVSKDGMVLAQGDWKGKEPRMAEVIVQAESGATAHKIITVQKTTDDVILITADVDDFKPTYTLNVTVRIAGTTGYNWRDNLDVKIGDEVEYQLFYTNTSVQNQYNVTLIDKLPANLEYVKGSTRLWNAEMDGYTNDDDTITTTGMNIGNYGPGANAYVRFRAKVVDDNLTCGSNMLVNWAKGTVNYGTEGEMVLQDFASVTLNKEIFSE